MLTCLVSTCCFLFSDPSWILQAIIQFSASNRPVMTYVWTLCKQQTSDDICLNSVQATDQWWHMSELCASNRPVMTYVWTLCKQQTSDDICLDSVQATDQWWHMSELALVFSSASEITLGKRLVPWSKLNFGVSFWNTTWMQVHRSYVYACSTNTCRVWNSEQYTA